MGVKKGRPYCVKLFLCSLDPPVNHRAHAKYSTNSLADDEEKRTELQQKLLQLENERNSFHSCNESVSVEDYLEYFATNDPDDVIPTPKDKEVVC